MSTPAPFTFQTPPGALQGVKPYGTGGPPEAGFYCVLLARLEATDKPASGKMILTVPAIADLQVPGKAGVGQAAHDGEIWAWWNNEVANPGNDPKIAEDNDKTKRQQATILESFGYAAAQYGSAAVNHTWILNKYAYISYVPPVQGATDSSKNAQVDFVSREKFYAAKAAGEVPQRRVRASGGSAAGVGAPPPGASWAAPPPGFAPPPGAPQAGQQGFAAPPAATPPAAAPPAGFAPPPNAAPPQGFAPPPGGFAPPPTR